MDHILNMMEKWNPIGQWLFLFFIVVMVFATFNNVFRLGVVLFRGWPACQCQLQLAEDDEEEDKKGA